MSASVPSYLTKSNSTRFSVTSVLRRVPLVMLTVIFSLISLRYLKDPIAAAAATGISFTSPEGLTVARVGFAAFPLAFAIMAFSCLISAQRLLTGLYMVLTVDSVVLAVRLFSIAVDHSSGQAVWLIIPEVVLMIISLIAIRLERARLDREVKIAAR